MDDAEKNGILGLHNELIVQSANLFVMARNALLGSLGALDIRFEEGNQFIGKLIAQGEVAEADLQRLLQEFRATIQANPPHPPQPLVEESVETILNNLPVPRFKAPSQHDIEALTQKIQQLTEKITGLKKEI